MNQIVAFASTGPENPQLLLPWTLFLLLKVTSQAFMLLGTVTLVLCIGSYLGLQIRPVPTPYLYTTKAGQDSRLL